MRTCNTCNTQKEIEAFPKDLRGRKVTRCKDCAAKYMKAYFDRKKKDPEWVLKDMDRHREKSRKALLKPGYKPQPAEKLALAQKKIREKFPEKKAAWKAVTIAVAAGKLIPQNCFCGKIGQAHHPDYSKPLEVLWLCTQHHADQHAKERREKILQKLQPS
jgi:hypothetical protein